MKKMLMLAAMAMMTAVASAISIGWTTDSIKKADAQGNVSDIDVGSGSSAWVRIALFEGSLTADQIKTVISSEPGNGTIRGNLRGTTVAGIVYTNVPEGNSLIVSHMWNLNPKNAQEKTFSDSVQYATTGNVALTKPDFTQNLKADQKYTLVVYDAYGDDKSNLLFAYDNDITYTAADIADGALYGYTYELGDVVVTAAGNNMAVTASVPEPTCLALLALGVAGLALKRKVK